MLINIFIVYEHTFTNTLRVIFNSFCHEERLNKLEYLTINEYLLGHRVSYDLLDKLVEKLKWILKDLKQMLLN